MVNKIQVKNEKFFKNKWQMLIYTVLFCVIIYLFIVIGKTDFSNQTPDEERFAEDYKMVGKNNVFNYINVVDAHLIAGGKKGIILFGNPKNPWVEYYAEIVNDVAKEMSIDKISYYDFYKDREQNNATYENMLLLLDPYITHNDLDKRDIYSPTLLVVCNNKILYFDSETSFTKGNITPSSYWTEQKKESKKSELRAIFRIYKES